MALLTMDLAALTAYCDNLLEAGRFDDYCPNGLQVEAGEEIGLLASGVTASQATIEAAVTAGANVLLVHHGFFWKGESPCIRGHKGRRIATLLRNGVSLLAYHLPLDVHPELGNNVCLARVLGITDPEPANGENGLLWCGMSPREAPLDVFAEQVATALNRTPLAIAGGAHPVRRLVWCTGAGQGYIERAAAVGADTYLSGEISEATVHLARELGVHYLAAGHHATERYGVKALGAHLADRFGIQHRHIDTDNPA